MTKPRHRDNGTSTDTERTAALDRTIDAYIDTHRPAQGPMAARNARKRAQAFVGLVREQGPDAIGGYLDALTVDQLYALTTTLAALVPDDVPVGDLLGWLDDAPGRVA